MVSYRQDVRAHPSGVDDEVATVNVRQRPCDGHDLRDLVNIVHNLTVRGIGLKVLTGQGAAIDSNTASGKVVDGIFAALTEFECELISKHTIAGLASARARGRKGWAPLQVDAGESPPRHGLRGPAQHQDWRPV